MNYKEFTKQLKTNEIAPVYLFTGCEELLIGEVIKKLKSMILDPEYSDFNDVQINADEESVDNVFEAIETLPFFQNKKFVLVKETPYFKAQQNKLSEAQQERLEEYLSNPSENVCLVFVASQVDKRKKIAKAIASKSGLVEFEKLDRVGFEKWLTQYIQSQEQQIDAAMLKYLVEMTGYLDRNSTLTLLEIAHELERLLAYVGNDQEINKDSIDAIFEKPLEYNVFMMTDGIAEGNSVVALRMLNELLEDGEPEIKILFMVARHYRILLRTKLSHDAGYTGKEMASKVGVAPFLINKYITQANRLGFNGIKKGLEHILHADRSIKTGKVESLLGLEMLVVKLSKNM